MSSSRGRPLALDAATRWTCAGGVAYTWDERGNLRSDGTFTSVALAGTAGDTWNAAGRLTATTDGTTTVQFGYDGDGNRLARQVEGGTLITYTLDVGLGLPEAIAESRGEAVTLYLHLPSVIAWDDGTDWHYGLADHLGSLRQVVDDSGIVESAGGYRPFGAVLEGDGGSGYGYSGEWAQADLGLVFLRARWYAPGVGRFLSRDAWRGSASRPGSLNGYAYVLGNPVRYTDSSGLDAAVAEWCLSNPFQCAAAASAAAAGGKVVVAGGLVIASGTIIWILLSNSPGTDVAPPLPLPHPPLDVPDVQPIPTEIYLSADGTRPLDIREPSPGPEGTPEPSPVRDPFVPPIPRCPTPKPPDDEPPEFLMHYTSKKGYQGIIHPGELGPYIMKPSHEERTAPAGIYFTDAAPYPSLWDSKWYDRNTMVAYIGIPYERTEYYILVNRKNLPGPWMKRDRFTRRPEWIYVTSVPVNVTMAVVRHGLVSDLP